MDAAENLRVCNEDLSYNLYLYRKRKETGAKRRAFARQLGIRPFRYRLIENGYVKPSEEEVGRISDHFLVDFRWYLEGFRNYPTELDNKKYLRVTSFVYYMFTKKAVRVVCLVLALLFLALTVAGFVVDPYLDYTRLDLYDEKIVEMSRAIREKGSKSFSIFNFSYPLVSENIEYGDGDERAVLIKSIYDENVQFITFSEIVWHDHYRYVLTFVSLTDDVCVYSVNTFDYEKYEPSSQIAFEGDGQFYVLSDEMGTLDDVIAQHLSQIDVRGDFTRLIKETLGVDLTFEEAVTLIAQVEAEYSFAYSFLWFFSIGTLLATCLFGFLFCYGTIYKKEKDAGFAFDRSDRLLGFKAKNKPVKKDLRFTPFLPETFLRVIGIALVFLGTVRVIFYTMNVGTYSSEYIRSAGELYSVQLLGIFLIFFINFDIYMDDNRLFRNLLLYPIVFVLVYAAEATLMTSLTDGPSILSLSLDKFTFPNPFGSATCYFLIMVFLFYTPRRANTKRKLTVYRSMAIIPIAYIIVCFLLGHSDIIFGNSFDSYWTKFLFREDRFSVSMLAIAYLVSLFFMRLHFKIKFGEENAYRYFMGNRFILAKNTLAVGLIVGIWIFDMIASTNATMRSLGFGQNKYLITLVPFVFFYHPHKNARNTKVDVLLISVYVVVLVMLYFSAGIVALISLV